MNKRNIILTLLLAIIAGFSANAQSFSINTDGSTADTSAILDVKSTAKGILIPRMTKTQRNAIFQPATGVLVFQSGPDSTGFYYYNGSTWLWMATASTSSGWLTTGNAGTDTAVNFIGTTDAMPIRFKQNNQWIGQFNKNQNNFFIGTDAGISNTTGTDNTAFGHNALKNNTSTFANTAFGSFALQNSTGGFNTAFGSGALLSNTTGSRNTAVGYYAMYGPVAGISGSGNIAIGDSTLVNITSGSSNVAVGNVALSKNTSGWRNVAVGDSALYTQSFNGGTNYFMDNTAVGSKALFYNQPTTTANGIKNTAVGSEALYLTTTGQENTAVGTGALHDNITGSQNTAVGRSAHRLSKSGTHGSYVGYEAGYNDSLGFRNTAVGAFAMRSMGSGTNNAALGYEALYSNTASNNTALGFVAARSNTSGTNILAIGDSALYANTSGTNNIAIGSRSMRSNTGGDFNIAIGKNTLTNNTGTNQNIAIGEDAMTDLNYNLLINVGNVAVGYQAMEHVNPVAVTNSGNQNTAVGLRSGRAITTGYYNTFLGALSGTTLLTTGFENTFIGHSSDGSGNQNTLIGASGLISGTRTNATGIGYNVTVSQNNSFVFGDANVTKWGFGTNTTAANILEFNSTVTTARLTTGGVWTNASDRNLKNNFTTLSGSDVLNRIMQLPVPRWSYKKEGSSVTHIGPMAQDFYQLFQTGGDDKTISSIDPSGVALIGIQELKKENDELRKELAAQKKMIEQLMQVVQNK